MALKMKCILCIPMHSLHPTEWLSACNYKVYWIMFQCVRPWLIFSLPNQEMSGALWLTAASSAEIDPGSLRGSASHWTNSLTHQVIMQCFIFQDKDSCGGRVYMGVIIGFFRETTSLLVGQRRPPVHCRTNWKEAGPLWSMRWWQHWNGIFALIYPQWGNFKFWVSSSLRYNNRNGSRIHFAFPGNTNWHSCENARSCYPGFISNYHTLMLTALANCFIRKT